MFLNHSNFVYKLCNSYEEFESVNNLYKDNKNNLIIYLFSAEKDKNNNNISWCSDCNNSCPLINNVLNEFVIDFFNNNNENDNNNIDIINKENKINNIIYIECQINKIYYKSNDNKYKLDNNIKLSCVPTLLINKEFNRNNKKINKLRLLDYECNSINNITNYFAQFL